MLLRKLHACFVWQLLLFQCFVISLYFLTVQCLASFCAGCICVFCFVAVMNVFVSIAVSFEVACASIHVYFHFINRLGDFDQIYSIGAFGDKDELVSF